MVETASKKAVNLLTAKTCPWCRSEPMPPNGGAPLPIVVYDCGTAKNYNPGGQHLRTERCWHREVHQLRAAASQAYNDMIDQRECPDDETFQESIDILDVAISRPYPDR